MAKRIINDRQRARKVYGFVQRLPDRVSTASSDAESEAAVLRLDWKESVQCASTSNYVLPRPALNLLDPVDGVPLLGGYRILLKDQTTTSENGIYYVDLAAGAWLRASDAVPATTMTCGATTYIEGGTVNGGTKWTLSTTNVTLGGSQTWTLHDIWAVNSSGDARLLSSPNPVGSLTVGGDYITDPSVFFFVSGSRAVTGPIPSAVALSVFGGDVVISGTVDLVRGDGLFGNLLEVTGTIASTFGISGSLTRLHDGRSYLVAGSNITISSASNGQVTISSTGGGGGATPAGSTGQIQFNTAGSLDASANLTFTTATNRFAVTGTIGSMGDILPSVDSTYNLGSADLRWANVYTGDLHLRNDRGDWTLIEAEETLLLRNNKTDRFYKFVLESIETPEDV